MRTAAVLMFSLFTPFLLHAAQDPEQTIVEELEVLADRARSERAADPWLLREIDELVRRHDTRWPRVLIKDDFSDGEFHHDPRWEVTRGLFWVGNDNVLHSRVDAKGDLSRIRVVREISNAFAVDARFTLYPHGGPARMALAVIQNNPERYGYRLRIHGGPDSAIELQRTSRHGKTTVGRARLSHRIDDGARHHLRWHHAPDDTVVVRLDGELLFKTKDSSFLDAYGKLVVRHNRGDLALHSIRVKGTR